MLDSAFQLPSVAQPRRDDLSRLIGAYDAEIAARKNRLLEDLNTYESKLHDLRQLDPLDFTGLQHLYGAHVSQIRQLLESFAPA